jgi:hypothetical protein
MCIKLVITNWLISKACLKSRNKLRRCVLYSYTFSCFCLMVKMWSMVERFWVTFVLILLLSGKLLYCPSSLIKTYQCFGGAYCLHHLPWRWNQHAFPKCWYLLIYQTIQYYAPEDGCCDTTMKTWYLVYLYVIASKCFWNDFISEKCKTVQSFKLHFLQNSRLTQLYTSASDFWKPFYESLAALLMHS